ncbi:leucyl aminopeptidase [Youngiibacter fragilis]|uniref:Probable cytosol aminopeptidase n=1 Tax=Youngiibacter fragilis 232.1 TaxID=994573 RepID=V7I4Q6_9CLOT|nr:leucyl aminopeptidase [Youngiibacter fragilis]ETA80868.1 cytosol aminopeptidase [Youngiibacter fragilis 232.1]
MMAEKSLHEMFSFTLDMEKENVVIPVCEDAAVEEAFREEYSFLSGKGIFTGKSGEVYSTLGAERKGVLIFIGLGKEKSVNLEKIRKAGFRAAQELASNKVAAACMRISKLSGLCYKETTKAWVEGMLQSAYSFDKYLAKKKDNPKLQMSFLIKEGKEDKVRSAISETMNLMDAVFLARDLVNEPAISLTPRTLAEVAGKELTPFGVEVEVLGRSAAADLGMEAFLAVAKGSSEEPKVIVMRYRGDAESSRLLGLVGKGVTYDSGGYSLKPKDSMVTMYDDMGGSAAVIGAMKALAANGVKRNVTAVVLATENMVNGEAYKPGDIIGSMAGKSIEILSTDAEGRLTLADALHYIITREKVDEVVDIATLTGACVVALGEQMSGAFASDDELMQRVRKAAEKAAEPTWQLPLNEEYRELVKGTRSDLKNSGGRWGGAISAAAFLREFTGDTPWVHLDIAGTAYLTSGKGYLPKGATGTGVKTLYNLALEAVEPGCGCGDRN